MAQLLPYLHCGNLPTTSFARNRPRQLIFTASTHLPVKNQYSLLTVWQIFSRYG